jgi:ADP-heptose:LPS heptosyltransferase
MRGNFGCAILVTGDAAEKRVAEGIASRIEGAVTLAGTLTLRETAALIERMALFITNDTGPMHIAFALKTPTIALFSPTDPRLCGPWHAEKVEVVEKPKVCNPCTGKKCYNPVCMGQITVEEVFARAEVLLRDSPRDDFRRDPCSLPLHNENS